MKDVTRRRIAEIRRELGGALSVADRASSNDGAAPTLAEPSYAFAAGYCKAVIKNALAELDLLIPEEEARPAPARCVVAA